MWIVFPVPRYRRLQGHRHQAAGEVVEGGVIVTRMIACRSLLERAIGVEPDERLQTWACR